MADTIKFRPGTKAGSAYTPALKVLSTKAPPKNNIVIGADLAQLRFISAVLTVEPMTVERVHDDSLLGREGLLLHVHGDYQIDLSPEVRSRTGLWSADAIVPGSSASEALIKYAYEIIAPGKPPLKREQISSISTQLLKSGVEDVFGTLWDAVWTLSSDLVPFKPWKEPWDSPVLWFDTEEPEKRLHYLYRYLVAHSYVHSYKEEPKAAAMKFSPSKIDRMKKTPLPINKVATTIQELSRWRTAPYDPMQCALKIAAIWT